MTEAKLANLTPLPGKLLFPEDSDMAKAYDALPSDAERFAQGGKWWSMYDIMKHFHSGILPEHGDSNYFEFEIDFTSPHLKVVAITDPNLLQEVNSTMTLGLQSLASKVQGLIGQLQVEASQKAMEITQAALNKPRGGARKKNKKGGDTPLGMPGQPPAAPAAPTGAVEQLTTLLNPNNLEAECLKDLFRIKLDTLTRIFITNAKDGRLPLASALNKPKQSAIEQQVIPIIANAEQQQQQPIMMGGKKYKTRKGRKSGKKGKTRRRYRNL
jgi:hypothetical protein